MCIFLAYISLWTVHDADNIGMHAILYIYIYTVELQYKINKKSTFCWRDYMYTTIQQLVVGKFSKKLLK